MFTLPRRRRAAASVVSALAMVIAAAGRYTALVGTSSPELSHAASFEVGP
jgi:hypothetical protein